MVRFQTTIKGRVDGTIGWVNLKDWLHRSALIGRLYRIELTAMFEAQLVVTDGNVPEVFSPWFPRQADNAIFTLEIVAKQGSTKLTVVLFTKTADDAGDGGAIGSAQDVGTVGRTALSQESDMQSLVRYQFTASAGSAGDWILFRLLPPTWFDTIRS